MNKLELIDALWKDAGISKPYARRIVEMFFEEISRALVMDDRVEIRRLFSFYVKKYKPYRGKNPKTGESIKVPAKKLPFFKCGKELRNRVHGRGEAVS